MGRPRRRRLLRPPAETRRRNRSGPQDDAKQHGTIPQTRHHDAGYLVPDLSESLSRRLRARRNRGAPPFTIHAAPAAGGPLRLERGTARFTYHDPCELGRGSGIYDEPRAVIEAIGELFEPADTRENALCCGSSVANTAITDGQQLRIARSVTAELEATGAETIVTACPLCKKASDAAQPTPKYETSRKSWRKRLRNKRRNPTKFRPNRFATDTQSTPK